MITEKKHVNNEIVTIQDTIRKKKVLLKYLVSVLGEEKDRIDEGNKGKYEDTMNKICRVIGGLHGLILPNAPRTKEKKKEHEKLIGDLKKLMSSLEECRKQHC